MTQEIWKSIPGYEGYEVSNMGQVRSFRGLGRPRILKPSVNRDGYTMVHLSGSTSPVFIHRLVMLAFEGPCPEGLEVCHGDHNRSNNHLDNLKYDTHQENMKDAAKRRSLIRKLFSPIGR